MTEMKGMKKATDRGYIVENPLPNDPENIKLSKAQFVAKMRLRREKEAKIAEFAKTLDAGENKAEESKKEPAETTEAPKKAPVEENKPRRGRPKNIA